MDAQIALPVFAINGRWILSNPGGTRNQPLLGVLADLPDRRTFERLGAAPYGCAFDYLFRIEAALIGEVTHLPTMLTGLLWKSVHAARCPSYLYSQYNPCACVTIKIINRNTRTTRLRKESADAPVRGYSKNLCRKD